MHDVLVNIADYGFAERITAYKTALIYIDAVLFFYSL